MGWCASLTTSLGQANGGFASSAELLDDDLDQLADCRQRRDFNGDGRDDILWRNPTTGEITSWRGQPNGSFVGNDANALSTIGTSWQVQPDPGLWG